MLGRFYGRRADRTVGSDLQIEAKCSPSIVLPPSGSRYLFGEKRSTILSMSLSTLWVFLFALLGDIALIDAAPDQFFNCPLKMSITNLPTGLLTSVVVVLPRHVARGSIWNDKGDSQRSRWFLMASKWRKRCYQLRNAATASTTLSCSSSRSSGNMGRASTSRAARSASGKSPSR